MRVWDSSLKHIKDQCVRVKVKSWHFTYKVSNKLIACNCIVYQTILVLKFNPYFLTICQRLHNKTEGIWKSCRIINYCVTKNEKNELVPQLIFLICIHALTLRSTQKYDTECDSAQQRCFAAEHQHDKQHGGHSTSADDAFQWVDHITDSWLANNTNLQEITGHQWCGLVV